MATVVSVPKDYPKEIIGYADPWIVSPGDNVDIKVSCTEAKYTYRTVRIIQGYEGDKSPRKRVEEIAATPQGSREGRFQIAHTGSYGTVKDVGLSSADEGLRISTYAQPWLIPCAHTQTLVSTLDAANKTGLDIVLNGEGQVEFWVGIGTAVQVVPTGFTPTRKRWVKIDLTVAGAQLETVVTPQSRGTEPAAKPTLLTVELKSQVKLASQTPLLVAAGRSAAPGDATEMGIRPNKDNAGRVDSLEFYASRTGSVEDIPTNKYNGRLDSLELRTTGANARVLAKYDFGIQISSDSIIDVSSNKRHGDLINAPSRAMKGYDWDGSETDWTKAKYGYGAIHFHEDDLDNAAWDTDFTIQIPADARSGVYGVELRSENDDVRETVVFYVRPSPARTSRVSQPGETVGF